jgi:hypothetical protein
MHLKTTAAELGVLMAAIKQKLGAREIISSYQVHFVETGKMAHIISVDFFAPANHTIESFSDLKEQINFEIIQLMEQQGLSFFEGDGLRK